MSYGTASPCLQRGVTEFWLAFRRIRHQHREADNNSRVGICPFRPMTLLDGCNHLIISDTNSCVPGNIISRLGKSKCAGWETDRRTIPENKRVRLGAP